MVSLLGNNVKRHANEVSTFGTGDGKNPQSP